MRSSGGHRRGWLLLSSRANPTCGYSLLLSQVFAESIFQLVRDKYAALADAGCPSSHARHKFLAGIVMTRGERGGDKALAFEG